MMSIPNPLFFLFLLCDLRASVVQNFLGCGCDALNSFRCMAIHAELNRRSRRSAASPRLRPNRHNRHNRHSHGFPHAARLVT